jgi:hypothetical protein
MVVAQDAGKSTLQSLLPFGGWLLAAAMAIWILQQFFGKVIQDLGSRFAVRLLRFVGGRVLGGRLLGKYRRALLRNYGEHPLGFRKEGTINVTQVYVPLQYLDEGHRRDVFEKIDICNRTVIVGEPGAGKSLLLKRRLIDWALGTNPSSDRKTPVLLELHRCNSTEKSFRDLIFEEFERNGVHGRQSMVDRALESGDLFVFFDGLDEVTSENHSRVVQLIKDFAQTWDECHYITTCRIAVYGGQLAPVFPSTIRIEDFDDAGIRRLLANWPDLDVADADRFFAGLTENPQLMRLGGSPLLLTMMVFLHIEVFAKTGRSLPGSRSAFYEVAVDHLLRRDRELARGDALSLFEGADKRVALQRIALTLQETPLEQADRRSIERRQLIGIVKDLAPDLNLREDQVAPLIKEIIERSQLIVQLDDRSALYAFRHLTLQEFLAAVELGGDPVRLVEWYLRDRSGWRETVRLWCGVTSLDCTKVVEKIFCGDDRDKILALQCVAEATRIHEGSAQRIIDHFIRMVIEEDPGAAVESALGAVASDDRPRGQSVLRRLEQQFANGSPGEAAIARVLASTRLPRAARVLGSRISENHARSALRTMGEQAVQVLAGSARIGDVRSVDDLGEIGTASATAALATLLWDESAVAFRAAWWIASLVVRREVNESLPASLPDSIDEYGLSRPHLGWVWIPFNAGPKMETVMGRVALLLGADVEGDVPPQIRRIDHRVGLPVVLLDQADGLGELAVAYDSASMDRLHVTLGEQLNVDGRARVGSISDSYNESIVRDERYRAQGRHFAELLRSRGIPPHRQLVLSLISPPIGQLVMETSLSRRSRDVSVRKWLESTAEIKSQKLLQGAPTALGFGMSMIVTAIAFWYSFGVLGVNLSGPPWLAVLTRCAVGMIAFIALLFLFSEVIYTSRNRLLSRIISISDFFYDKVFDIDETVGRLALIVAGSVCFAATWLTLGAWWGSAVAISIYAGSLLLILGSVVLARRQRLRLRNPFRRLVSITEQELAFLSTRSVQRRRNSYENP